MTTYIGLLILEKFATENIDLILRQNRSPRKDEADCTTVTLRQGAGDDATNFCADFSAMSIVFLEGNRYDDSELDASNIFREVTDMTLGELPVGKAAKILAVNGNGVIRDRLLDMGLTPRTRIMVRKVAPLGDPIELSVRSYALTLRKEDANNILVEETEV